jgi:hypothetical protein
MYLSFAAGYLMEKLLFIASIVFVAGMLALLFDLSWYFINGVFLF